MRFKRIICRVFGCNGDEISCERCGSYTYKPGYVGSGILREMSIRVRMAWCRFDRLICRVWGCNTHGKNLGGCDRCGADLYDADFVQLSLIRDAWRAIRRAYYRLKHQIRPPKCEICGKRMKWDDNLGIWDCGIYDDDHMPF